MDPNLLTLVGVGAGIVLVWVVLLKLQARAVARRRAILRALADQQGLTYEETIYGAVVRGQRDDATLYVEAGYGDDGGVRGRKPAGERVSWGVALPTDLPGFFLTAYASERDRDLDRYGDKVRRPHRKVGRKRRPGFVDDDGEPTRQRPLAAVDPELDDAFDLASEAAVPPAAARVLTAPEVKAELLALASARRANTIVNASVYTASRDGKHQLQVSTATRGCPDAVDLRAIDDLLRVARVIARAATAPG